MDQLLLKLAGPCSAAAAAAAAGGGGSAAGGGGSGTLLLVLDTCAMLAAAGLHQWAWRKTPLAGTREGGTTTAAGGGAGGSNGISAAAGDGGGSTDADGEKASANVSSARQRVYYYPWDVVPVGKNQLVVTLHGGDDTTGVVLCGEYTVGQNMAAPAGAGSALNPAVGGCSGLHGVGGVLSAAAAAAGGGGVYAASRAPGGGGGVYPAAAAGPAGGNALPTAAGGSWVSVHHLSAHWPQELLRHPNMMEVDPWLKLCSEQSPHSHPTKASVLAEIK